MEQVKDILYPSDNYYDIPVLLFEMQASRLELPCVPYGTASKLQGARTIHYYVEDYRFAGLWGNPAKGVNENTYEQRTPSKGGASFKKALDHAAEKQADVAVIYDKHYKYHSQDVENGIKQFEYYRRHRFKRIIVISQAGNVYEHLHNT